MTAFFAACALVWAQPPISGVVKDGSLPVAGATVRIQATGAFARTNDRGEFTAMLEDEFQGDDCALQRLAGEKKCNTEA